MTHAAFVRLERTLSAFALALCGLQAACGSSDDEPRSPKVDASEELSGGDTTVFDTTPNAFSLSARNMTSERRSDFFVGNAFVKDSWVTAPSSTAARDGLGPLFNARSCTTCHLKDGRGGPPENEGDPAIALLFRLSIPGATEHGDPLGEPVYGGQLQPSGIQGVPGEGRPVVRYTERPGQFADGASYSLLEPSYSFADLSYGAMRSDVMFSPRLAPAMIGLGLLELVPEADVLALADPDDANADGISGRPNYVWDAQHGRRALGRFGWKANQPSIFQQVTGAFRGDIGITSSLFTADDCTAGEAACIAAPNGGVPEISDTILHQVVFYSQTLAVPARRDFSAADVLRGKALFGSAGCASCHVARLATGSDPNLPELSGQTIFPYTDLLLHDMGPELADGRPDFDASGSEWRTPPLWGLGLFHVVNGQSRLMHDGRARDPMEAILWHGGEGAASRDRVRQMSAADRASLLRFLESL